MLLKLRRKVTYLLLAAAAALLLLGSPAAPVLADCHSVSTPVCSK